MKVRVAIANASGDIERCPEFTKAEITIGRTAANDVVVPDAGVSSAHARVLVTGGSLTILDLDSTNGTFVNEDPVRGPRVLGENDVVQIGDFTLTFTLDGVEKSMRAPAPSAPPSPGLPFVAPAAPGADWPEPPPMMDELGESPPMAGPMGAEPPSMREPPPMGGSMRESASMGGPMAMGGPAPRLIPPPEPVQATPAPRRHERPAMFPPLESVPPQPSVPPSTPASPPGSRPPSPPLAPARGQISEAFEFEPASADVLKNRVFQVVWSRVSRDVARAAPGVRPRVERLLRTALHAAARVGRLNPDKLREAMIEEMMTDGPLPSLLEGDPTEVLIVGTTRIRINRGGHITEGPSPFTCGAAITAIVSRLCGSSFDAGHPTTRGSYRDYAVEAIHDVGGGGQAIVSLRRVSPKGSTTVEQLVQTGILSHPMGSLLSACIVGRQNILMCSGPGATCRPVMGALMSAAPAQELQVVVTHRGVDPSAFRQGAVVLTRGANDHNVLAGALALGPDRIAIDDVQWNEASTVSGLVARSLSVVLGLRAPSAGVALSHLVAMLEGIVQKGALEQLLMRSIDVIVATQVFGDGVTRVTQIAEPIFHESGTLTTQDIFTLVPGSRTWQYTGVTPRCSEELLRRGFPLDPSLFGGTHG